MPHDKERWKKREKKVKGERNQSFQYRLRIKTDAEVSH
jgi:hypothetical protein